MTPTPHDALFKEVYSDPERMASLLRQALSQDVLGLLDLSTLRLLPGSWIDPSLAETRSDLLYEVQGHDGCALYLYVLFEHKSRPERFVTLDLLAYIVSIWQQHRKVRPRATHLPAVLPLVLYHGAERWSAPLDLGELLDLSEAALASLRPSMPTYTATLRDLSQFTEDELRAQAIDALDRLTQLLLRHGADDDLFDRMSGWRDDLARVAQHNGLRAIRSFLSYLGIVQGQRPSEPVRRLLVEALGPPGEEVYMSWQDQLMAQGEAIGEARGEARGQALGEARGRRAEQRRMFLSLLRQRFGEPSTDVVARVEAASTETLTAWTDRFFSATSVDELLADG